jgi:hypothetical protein
MASMASESREDRRGEASRPGRRLAPVATLSPSCLPSFPPKSFTPISLALIVCRVCKDGVDVAEVFMEAVIRLPV